MYHADILNELDEIIYVVEMESYELLYLNRAAREMCAGERETLGRKCHKVLQGRDEPCHFCPVDDLRDDAFHSWEYANLKFGRHFLVRDKIVSWNGRKAAGVPERGDEFRRLVCARNAAWREARDRIVIVGPAGEGDAAPAVPPPPGVEAAMSVPVEWGNGHSPGPRGFLPRPVPLRSARSFSVRVLSE